MIEKEFRKIDNNITLDENRTITGYALVFNSLSKNLGGFVEKINSDALDGVIEKSDIYFLFNHDSDKVLARSKYGVGSLKLEIDSKGLKYSFEAMNNDLSNTTLEFIKRGDISTSSFAFTIADGGDEWIKNIDGTYTRTIKKIDRLFDNSVVWNEAYSATSVECKRFGEIQEIEAEEMRKQIEIENQKEIEKQLEIEKEIENRKIELENYFSDLQKRILKK